MSFLRSSNKTGFLQTAKRYCKVFFSPGPVFGYVVIIGLILFCIGYFYGSPPAAPPAQWSAPWWVELSGKLGSLLFVGGVIGGVSRYLGAIGVFQEAVSKVVTEDGYLDKLKDLDELWCRLTQKIYLKGFKSETPADMLFTEKVQEAIKQSIEYEDKFFAHDLVTRLVISLKVGASNVVEVERTSTYTVVPFDGTVPAP